MAKFKGLAGIKRGRKPLESKLQDRVVDELKRRNAWYMVVMGGGSVPTGTPDILAAYQGKFIGIELKRPGGKYKPTREQKEHLHHLTQTGNIGLVCQTVLFLNEVLDALERQDTQWLFDHGWQSHGELEINDHLWMEEVIW